MQLHTKTNNNGQPLLSANEMTPSNFNNVTVRDFFPAIPFKLI